MVFDSNQINQMIGGQQAMFANHAAYAHNIGAQAGFGGTPQGLSTPTFNSPGGMGAAAVGALGQAIPGVASGLSLAGGLGMMGSVGAYADPFTGVGRAFLGGARAAGGLGGGVGALGAGLRAAAPAAGLYYAGYKAVSHVGEQLYQGAQNISQVGGMAQQYMGPSYGEAGARPGGQMARAQIQNITSILHEVAGDDTASSMKDLMQVMDKAGRFGMLTGIQSAEQFKQKFKGIVDKASTIAKVMGTTIEEAMPALQNFNQMGLWSTQDIMGASLAMKAVGPQGAGALQQTMMTGAQRSHAMGGSLAAGAALGRNQFMNVQAALRSGAINDEMLTEFTGGVGGVQGQQMLADRLTGALQSMTQTPMGRLTMAGLGEMRDGEFTGRIDAGKLASFQKGEISVGQLQQMGQRNARTREGAASFTYRQEQIGQELMAQGGMELVGSMFQSALDKAGFAGASDDIQGLMLQKMYGLNRRDSQMMQKLLKKMPEIQERRSRRELAVLQDSLRKAEEKQNRSWDGFKDAVGQAFEETMERPIQELGEKLATRWSESIDTLKDELSGRVQQVNITRQERMRRALSEPGPRGGARAGQVQAAMDLFRNSSLQQTFGDTTVTQRIRQEGFFGGMVGAGLAGLGFETGAGTRAEMLLRSGARGRIGEGGASDIQYSDVGEGIYIPGSEVSAITERIRMRGGAPQVDRMFKKGQKTQTALSKMKSAYTKLTNNVTLMKEIREKKEEMSPADYQEWLVGKLRAEGGPEVEEAIRTLQEGSSQKDATGLSAALDAISVVQNEADYQKTGLEIDFAKMSSESGANMEKILQDGEAFSEEVTKRSGKLLETLQGKTTSINPYSKFGSGMTTTYKRKIDVTEKQLRTMLTEEGEASEQLMQFLQSDSTDLSQFPALQKKMDDPKFRSVIEAAGQMSASERQGLAAQAKGEGNVGVLMQGKIAMETITERGQAAGEELAALGKGGPRQLRDILGQLQRAGQGGPGSFERYQQAKEQAQAFAKTLGAGDIKRLRASGGAVAEHIADLAEIESLDPSKMKGMSQQQLQNMLRQKGLRDEVATGMAGLPEGERKQLEAVLESKKITKEQAEFLKKTLQKVEQKVGLEDSRTAREETQVRLNNSLTSFVGANREFVIAVAQAVPALSTLEGGKVSDAMKKISQNQATAGGD